MATLLQLPPRSQRELRAARRVGRRPGEGSCPSPPAGTMPASVTPTALKKKVKHTSIHEAVKAGDVEQLEEMVKSGSSMNEMDPVFRFTPLHWAAHLGSLEALAINGVNLGVQDERGCTPAHLAANHGQSYTLQTILRSGVDVNISDKNNWQPIHNAAFHGRLGCLQLLIRWGATLDDVDSNGNLPVHLAAMEGHLHCFKYLVSKMPSLSHSLKARNDHGETLRDLAQRFYKDNIVDYIDSLQKGKGQLQKPEDLTFPGHDAAFRGELKTLRTLLENRVININERDDKGSTLLHKAAGQGHLHVLEWLIDREADCNITNEAGETPKDTAQRFAQLAAVEFLKSKMGNDSDEEVDPADARFFKSHGVEGSTDCKGDLDLDEESKMDARERAYRQIEELKQRLEIATSNFKQLGGISAQEREKKQEERKLERTIRELQAQLENERIRREKLEAQMDEYREEIGKLKDLQDQHQATATASTMAQEVTSDSGKEKKKVKRKSISSPGGVFVRRY